MGEAILAKGSIYVKDIEPSGINNCMIVDSGYYTCTKSGNYKVVCIGGGGGGGGGITPGVNYMTYDSPYWLIHQIIVSPGGSGFYNSATVHLNNGDNVYVTIGSGGTGGGWSNTFQSFQWTNTYVNPTSGGTTSFGSYVAANGGSFTNSNVASGHNSGVAIEELYWDTGDYYKTAYSSNGNSFSRNTCATGGYLYFNGSYDVSNVETNGLRLYYGEGGNSGIIMWNNNSNYWMASTNGISGNNGVVLISWAD